jgi:chromosome partitioning protein
VPPRQRSSGATIIAVANQKGGVAKTTSVASLGAAFAELGKRVLLGRPAREYVLQTALADVRKDYDLILIDCSPSLGVLTLNALTAANGLIIPMACEMLSHRGDGQLLDTVADVKKFLNKKLKVIGILPTLFDGRSNHAQEVLSDVGERYGLPVLSPPIPRTVRFAEAPAVGRSILATSRSSKGARAYRDVAKSVVATL